MHIAVAGAGFVGLATAVGFARHGHSVMLFDVDRDRLACLRGGYLPFREPSLDGAFQAVLDDTLRVAGGGLDVTSPNGAGPYDLVFNCVGTPPRADGSLNLTAVREVSWAAAAGSNGTIPIVNRSTVPPGTAATLEAEIRAEFPAAAVLANPEFLREGSALYDFEHPPRRVIGGSSAEALDVLARLYGFSDAPLVVTDTTSAELIKVGANAALAVRVSMANEIADVASALGIDAESVLSVIGEDPRIGRDYLTPGIGFGGMCLPKDLDAYRAASRLLGARSHVFDGAAATNDEAPYRLVERVLEAMNGDDSRVCVAGVGFKRGSDQTRGSRAALLVEALLERGVPVSVYDPLAESNARRQFGNRVDYLQTLAPLPRDHRVVIFTHGVTPEAFDLPDHVLPLDGLGREQRTGTRAAQAGSVPG